MDIFARQDEFIRACRDNRYLDFVLAINNKYRHWSKIRYMARHAGLDPDIAWELTIASRESRFVDLPLIAVSGQHLRISVPNLAQRELMHIDQRLAGTIDFGGSRKLSEDERQQLIYTSLHEEAITSSMLEGAATTRREAQEMLRLGRTPRSHGERMVYNNFKAIEFIREHRYTPLTPEFVTELQSILTHDTLERPQDVGRVRDEQDRVHVFDERTGDVIHTPPPAPELPARLQALCDFANATDEDDASFIHPVMRSIALHFQLAYDHPYCDGNGRTARALFYWSMLHRGYWLFEYLPISRLIYRAPSKYVTAFLYTETDDFDLTYFLVYHLRLIAQATRDLQEHVQKKRAEALERQSSARPSGLQNRQWEMLRRLRSSPAQAITVETYRHQMAISYGTARNDLLTLEARGLLKRIKRGRKFVFLAR